MVVGKDIETPHEESGVKEMMEVAESGSAEEPVKAKGEQLWPRLLPLLFLVFVLTAVPRGFQAAMIYRKSNPVSLRLTYDAGLLMPRIGRESAKMYLAEQGVSNLDEYNRNGSPQNLALEFVASLPQPRGGGLVDRYDFVTKYVLAVLYYSTNGKEWHYSLNFLSKRDKPVCNWFEEIKYPDDSKELRGVACDDKTKQISTLKLARNNLRGNLPTELALLTSLTTVDVSFNQLKGSIPDTFSKLSNLETYRSSSTQLTGSIPHWIDAWHNIKDIDLSHNAFSGSIPQAIDKLEHLTGIALNSNQLTGKLAFGTRGLKNLESFFADDNYFTFMDSDFLGASTGLRHLDISNNFIQANVSKHLFGFPKLQVLDLSDNQFENLPYIIHKQESLYLLALQKNNFTNQPVPPSIANLKNLTHLDVSQNAFTGEIPHQIANLDLTYLFVAQNDFVPGPVPSWMQSMTNLQELDLKSTHRTGTIPSFLGDLSDLVLLDLDNNGLQGTIPDSLGSLSKLSVLLLNRNNLTSSVPSSFAKLKNLKLMFLEGNNAITGTLDGICANNKIPIKSAVVADCNLCEPYEGCCHECCQSGERCNKGVFVPHLDPVWQLGYKRVFFTFNREYFIEKHAKKVVEEAEAESRNAGLEQEEDSLESAREEGALKPVEPEGKEALEPEEVEALAPEEED